MLNVEEALSRLSDLVQHSLYSYNQETPYRFNKWDQEFVLDIDAHVQEGKAISTAQGAIVLKLIKQYRFYLEQSGVKPDAIDDLLNNPTYRTTPYQSTVLPREVRWAGGNHLAFRCKYNQSVVDDIKRLRWKTPLSNGQGSPYFVHSVKLWVVQVTDENLEQVMSVIQRHRFAFDSDVEQMFLRIANSSRDRGSVNLDGDKLVVETSNDSFMYHWVQTVLRLDGQDV